MSRASRRSAERVGEPEVEPAGELGVALIHLARRGRQRIVARPAHGEGRVRVVGRELREAGADGQEWRAGQSGPRREHDVPGRVPERSVGRRLRVLLGRRPSARGLEPEPPVVLPAAAGAVVGAVQQRAGRITIVAVVDRHADGGRDVEVAGNGVGRHRGEAERECHGNHREAKSQTHELLPHPAASRRRRGSVIGEVAGANTRSRGRCGTGDETFGLRSGHPCAGRRRGTIAGRRGSRQAWIAVQWEAA